MKRNLSVNFIYKTIFTALLVLTCISYAAAIKVSGEIGTWQAKAVHSELLDLYVEKLDATFSNGENYLIRYISTSNDVISEASPKNELEWALAKTAIYNDLSNGVLLHSDIDVFFYYNLEDDVYIQARSVKIQETNIDLKSELFKLLQSKEPITAGWKLVGSGDSYYMLRTERYRSAYVGVWLSLDSIVSSLRETYQKDGGDAVILNANGQMLTKTGLKLNPQQKFHTAYITAENDEKFLRLCQKSRYTPLVIAAFISHDELLKDLKKTSIVLTCLMLFIVVVIVFALLVLKRVLFRPLFELSENMKKIQDGNLMLRMRQNVWQQEFDIVFKAFNDMMDEVGRLKIDVYEQQIKYQKMWLQYLQVQIQPHFFLNTLNMIYNMSNLGQNEMIQKLSLYLVTYFRYLFREPLSCVTLETELKHVRDYLEIQKMRFPGQFEYQIEIGEDEKNTVIPPLILQTYVENCVKHAGFTGKTGKITVSARRLGMNVEITISDNGKGFSVEMLKLLNDETQTISQDKVDHIGIDNARLRLKLFFENNYYNMFYNSSGAVVKLVIPYMEARTDVPCDFDR